MSYSSLATTSSTVAVTVGEEEMVDDEESLPQHLPTDYVDMTLLAVVALVGTPINVILISKLTKLFWIRTKTKHLVNWRVLCPGITHMYIVSGYNYSHGISYIICTS